MVFNWKSPEEHGISHALTICSVFYTNGLHGSFIISPNYSRFDWWTYHDFFYLHGLGTVPDNFVDQLLQRSASWSTLFTSELTIGEVRNWKEACNNIPIPSMYGMSTYLHLVVLMVNSLNVGKYTLHGCYGIGCLYLVAAVQWFYIIQYMLSMSTCQRNWSSVHEFKCFISMMVWGVIHDDQDSRM